MNEFMVAIVALIGTIVGASISGFVSLLSIRVNAKIDEQQSYHSRIIHDYLDNGFRELIICCNACIEIYNRDEFSSFSKDIQLPFGNALKLDFRYGTQFYKYLLLIDKYFQEAEDGKAISKEFVDLLVALQYELYWFNNIQSIYVGAKQIRLQIWQIHAFFRFFKKRKTMKRYFANSF